MFVKPVRYHKNYLVHDEDQKCVVGDIVRIKLCQKISKRKSFEFDEFIKPAARYVDDDGVLHTQKQPYATNK